MHNDFTIEPKAVEVTGPIPVTDKSHPFSAAAFSRVPMDLEPFGFSEEEYFVKGSADVYGTDTGGALTVRERALPYETRILVRRPKNGRDRKPRVFLDILNATNGYDIEDLWRRSRRYILENGYSYVGVTAKPINVLALKYFDYNRYRNLNWAGSAKGLSPSVPDTCHRIAGCEEGLVWDILTQLGHWIKTDGKSLFSDGQKLSVYLTGQSQSGMYLNTYVNQIHRYLRRGLYHGAEPLFDGYFSLVGGGMQRSLFQTSGDDVLMCIRDEYGENPVDVPFISITTEGDYGLFNSIPSFKMKTGYNSDSPGDKRRYYEFPGAPHTDASSPLVPSNDEIVKCKCPKRILDGEYEHRLNDFPLEYFINGLLEKLHIWASEGTAPESKPLMEKDENGILKRDRYGNVLGGFRTVFVDVPKASYKGSCPGQEIGGTMSFFDEKTVKELYGGKAAYLEAFRKRAEEHLNLGEVLKSDFDRMVKWAEMTDK
ncbi:alpha/beta hydrolase domain-containing protein [Treponema parvum]|uniref:alpha/beta hydrolase domain-containing protein n=1 Tax=Treponema parvum TaxID=138851 RepID=UPI001AEC555D|nr:alpha/beta hydrolase domain-containing protein [Treponema parvum]QTQ16095.1 hypothetical protein HXT04_04960 [Treponema parvum]